MGETMSPRALALCAALGAVFFMITATTFASLGVVLPAMIAEFGWSWATAGLGFTMLALMTGVFSPMAAASLERLGPKLHYAFGGGVICAGYLLLAAADGASAYLVATSMLGAGFALLANVPGTYLVGRAMPIERRSVAIGAYLAAGGFGGVLGPLIANAMIDGGGWRDYWRVSAIFVGAAAFVVVALVERGSPRSSDPDEASKVEDRASLAWTARQAMQTPAFAIIAAALTVAYFCGVTVSTFSVAHLQAAGLAPAVAVLTFSLYSGVNAGARALGGALVRYVNPQKLLCAALLANVVGMLALANAKSASIAIVFAVFDGFAFGMALFATTALLIDYYGLKNSPALLGAANLAATVAMLGPTLAGETADRWGGFTPIFVLYAVGALVAAIAVALMKNPVNTKEAAPAERDTPTSAPAPASREY